jgi:RNA polymerase primary sigma factor
MSIHRASEDRDHLATLDSEATRLLTAKEERALLRELAGCKARLGQALARVPGYLPPDDVDDPQALSHHIANFYAKAAKQGATQARLGAVYQKYRQLRTRLAMANMRLVAHVAKRFRERGVAYSDLLQDGFCGLLEAIDRFDLSRETKLATYATWWIRQAIQRSVAAGAYPVRLSPRHLRQLAQNQDELETVVTSGRGARPVSGSDPVSSEVLQRIHAATRPTVSLNANLDTDSNFSLLQTISDPEGAGTEDVDLDEAVGKLLSSLRPREQEVLALRFGLGGKPRLSLSQVGKVMEVSKERVRQIQDRALEKLRVVAREDGLMDLELEVV